MKAVGYKKPSPIAEKDSLVDINLPEPSATGRDLLVEVKAVSVNPVDVKVRAKGAPSRTEYKILGWDAAGIVKHVGPDCTIFKPGDEVFYAGSIARSGTNAEFHLVDERIVGTKPKSLNFGDAAALPLTSLTAWELLFDRLGIRVGNQDDKRNLLVIGGAGGVGSILIQLARKLTGLTVIATASRPRTREWCLEQGAHHVIDHSAQLKEQLIAIGIREVELVASLSGTEGHYPDLVEVIAPQGSLGVIDDPSTLDVVPLKGKSISLHWESMFTRSVYTTADMVAQHEILDSVSRMVDSGNIRTTLSTRFGLINATNLKLAHTLIESKRSHGKVVLEGF